MPVALMESAALMDGTAQALTARRRIQKSDISGAGVNSKVEIGFM